MPSRTIRSRTSFSTKRSVIPAKNGSASTLARQTFTLSTIKERWPSNLQGVWNAVPAWLPASMDPWIGNIRKEDLVCSIGLDDGTTRRIRSLNLHPGIKKRFSQYQDNPPHFLCPWTMPGKAKKLCWMIGHGKDLPSLNSREDFSHFQIGIQYLYENSFHFWLYSKLLKFHKRYELSAYYIKWQKLALNLLDLSCFSILRYYKDGLPTW